MCCQVPALKYQLPSSPEVYVDLVDDEDVALMIDEWREAVAGGASTLRLHIFVQVILLLLHLCVRPQIACLSTCIVPAVWLPVACLPFPSVGSLMPVRSLQC